MEVILYNTASPVQKLNKSLKDERRVTGNLIEDCGVMSPQFTLSEYIVSNYCYIPLFKRYYWVKDVVITTGGLYTYTLEEDVLMSFKDQIMKSTAYIETRGDDKMINRAVVDDSVLSQRTENVTLEFPHGFSEIPYYVLVTKGVF